MVSECLEKIQNNCLCAHCHGRDAWGVRAVNGCWFTQATHTSLLAFANHNRQRFKQEIDMKTGKDSSEKKKSVAKSSAAQVWHIVATTLYQKITDRRGVFGVSGRHFHTILICREQLETGLQTVQAVRMSKFLPRTSLNRFYVCLLVVNCWSSVFIYSRWFWKNEAQRRFAAIACDCALDLMSTMGVSVMIVLSYVNQYNVGLTGFDFDLLGDDEWVAQMLNEAQMVVVVSWSDLTTRFIFSLGLIITTTNMKELLHYTRRSGNRVAHSGRSDAGSLALISPALSAGVREAVANSTVFTKAKSATLSTQPTQQYTDAGTNGPSGRVLLHGVHFLFTAWGVVVLILHIHASMKSSLVECMPRVHPIAGTLPSCFMVNFNCHKLRISGEREAAQAEWDKFEFNTVMKLQFLRCPALEVPGQFQKFRRLVEIRVYNSTIMEWGAEAAITNAHHPDMTMVSVVRTLPDELDTKWHIGSSIYLENSNLTVIPSVLMRLQPYYLTLAGNPIEEFPPELFEVDYLQYIILGRTNVRELPQTVTQPIMGPAMIDITNTNISFFWSLKICETLHRRSLVVAPLIAPNGKIS